MRLMTLVAIALLGWKSMTFAQATRPALNPNLPTLWIASDSTAASGQRGWGSHMSDYLDTTKLNIANRAVGGRSSRTFITGGSWDRMLDQFKPGDFVLIQFGHNDISPINDDSRARGVIQGIGEESQEIDNQLTKQPEVVHTFGWYMRKMIADTQSKGATPIVVSMTVRNHWTEGKLERGAGEMARFAVQVAKDQGVQYVDLNTMAADILEPMGEAEITKYFSPDRTHTTVEGADFFAQQIVLGLKGLKESAFTKFVTEKGNALAAK